MTTFHDLTVKNLAVLGDCDIGGSLTGGGGGSLGIGAAIADADPYWLLASDTDSQLTMAPARYYDNAPWDDERSVWVVSDPDDNSEVSLMTALRVDDSNFAGVLQAVWGDNDASSSNVWIGGYANGTGGLNNFYVDVSMFDTPYLQLYGNIALGNEQWLDFNWTDTNWRMGYGLNAFTKEVVGASTAIEIVIGTDTGGPDGFAIGQSSGGSIFELRGNGKSAYFAGPVTLGTYTEGNVPIFSTGGLLAEASRSGGTTVLGTTSGTLTEGKQLEFDADGNIIASSADIGGAAPQLLQSSTVTMTAAQIKAGDIITVVPAPGSNLYIQPVSYVEHHTFDTTGLQVLQSLALYYEGAGASSFFVQGGGSIGSPDTVSKIGLRAVLANGTYNHQATDIINQAVLAQFDPLPSVGGEISTTSLDNGGSGYVVNDTGTIDGDMGDATYIVNSVDGGGAVLTYTITASGSYYIPTTNVATFTGGGQPGVGVGFTLDILTATQPGDGDLTITLEYIIIDATTGQPVAGTPPGGSGAIGYIPKWTSITTQGNSQLYDSGTKILLGSQSDGDFDAGTLLGVVGQIEIHGHPIGDPGIAGALYEDSGTHALMVSQGP